ncbi:hypothetical protein [Actinomadura opuntiae]|uniref:hypothetical protein n=1 Tax=Actinomadura sp. OS1-43 TaxID=604315 RepID=UPI00255AF2A8|nr:hypothetical protein [Actinomadura sp. OS1-43]MDL4812790.1 hypothetical protein [Actinomadura sp. OS1-43]
MISEPRYTLDQARQLLARQECRARGHDLDIVTSTAGEPLSAHCSRGCGHPGWRLVPIISTSPAAGAPTRAPQHPGDTRP